jgi:ubiquinone/menaquinone biosynthesis C-methylase UbiE
MKGAVGNFWNSEPCGTRYLDRRQSYEAHAEARYALEPHIWAFADFPSAQGKRVLEIGVGIGADYEQWLRAGAIASGVDLSPRSLENARNRCQQAGFAPDLKVGDAEHLDFADNTFDIVYSYGVMHHTPNTQQCLREAWRVLKPGGQLKVMLYHHPSLTGIMLWLLYGMFRGKSVRECVLKHLESPGTKSFTWEEVRDMVQGFRDIQMNLVFSPGDLLLHKPSARFQGRLYRLLWAIYPRRILRACAGGYGLFLLVSARKALAAE